MRSANLITLRRRVAASKLQAYRRARDAKHEPVDEGVEEWFLPNPEVAGEAPVDRAVNFTAWVMEFDGRRRDRWNEDCPCCRRVHDFGFGLSASGSALEKEIATLCLLEPAAHPVARFREAVASLPERQRALFHRIEVETPPAPNPAPALSEADRQVIEWYERLHRQGPQWLLAALELQPAELHAFGRLRDRLVSSLPGLAIDSHFEVERAALLALATVPLWRGSLAQWKGGSATSLLRHVLGPRVPMGALFAALMDRSYIGATGGFDAGSWILYSHAIAADPLLWIVAEAQGASIRRIARRYGVAVPSTLIADVVSESDEARETEPFGDFCMANLIAHAAVRALGGGNSEARRAGWLHPGLATRPAYAAFWEGAVRWLRRWRGWLTDEQAQRVMNWGYHRQTEDPAFSFRGRSVRAVLRHTDAYYQEIHQRNVDDHIAWQRASLDLAPPENQSWNPKGWNLAWRDDAGTRWSMAELTDALALSDEGAALRHCVGAYATACVEGRSAILQLRRNGVRSVTIEVNLATSRVVQACGRFNSQPKKDARAAIIVWAERFGIECRT